MNTIHSSQSLPFLENTFSEIQQQADSLQNDITNSRVDALTILTISNLSFRLSVLNTAFQRVTSNNSTEASRALGNSITNLNQQLSGSLREAATRIREALNSNNQNRPLA